MTNTNDTPKQKPNDDSSPIAVKDLHKSFGRKPVLAGVDFSVAHGETVCLLGRSGTGKSVLLKLLIGLQKPDSGTIEINGKNIAQLDLNALNEVRKKVGFLFQNAALYDALSVEENVGFPLKRHAKLAATERAGRVETLLSQVGMGEDSKKMPSEISGGMQKRVGLARALALEPELLLFDEPTAGLDPITAREIGELISKLRNERQLTSLVVTHDIPVARQFSNRFIVLNEGHLAFQGTWEELQQSQDPFVQQFLSSIA